MIGLAAPPERSRSAFGRSVRIGLFLAWLASVLFLVSRHVVWRDEVRALSLALQGDSVVAMLRGLHGEGHPAVWYLLLRSAHAVVGRPEVLLVVSVAVAAAAALLLVLRSPFSAPVLAALLATQVLVYEYSVVARNYGISMLVLFLFAAAYERHRDRGVVLGWLLFLLVNCNLHGVLLAGGLALFWVIDTAQRGEWTARAGRVLLLNGVIVLAGIALCAATVLPTFNDAAIAGPAGRGAWPLLEPVVLPGLGLGALFGASGSTSEALRLTLLLVATLLGLSRRPAALAAAAASLLAFDAFFGWVSQGYYRHAALWFVLLVTLYWITHATPPTVRGRWSFAARVSPLGSLAFLVVVLWLARDGVVTVKQAVTGTALPASQSRRMGSLIASDPELRRAILLADPDFLLEALPYYCSNRTWLMRERRFGNVVHFTRHSLLSLSLGDVLRSARTLRAEQGVPVLILLRHHLDPTAPEQLVREGYDWTFQITPEQVREFEAATSLVDRAQPVSGDESFDVYLLK